MAAQLITIATYRTAFAAQAAQEVLREAGIEAWLSDDPKERGPQPRAFIELRVAEGDREAAIEIISGSTRPSG